MLYPNIPLIIILIRKDQSCKSLRGGHPSKPYFAYVIRVQGDRKG